MPFNDEFVQLLKEKYPTGTRIVVDYMGEDPNPIAPGTAGTVKSVDDAGTLHCVFDNGRSLGIVPGEDEFHIEKERYIKVVLCEPGKKARTTTILNDLKTMQRMVGGYIQCVYPYTDPVGIVCDEEGKLKGTALNRALRDEQGRIYDILSGPFLVVGLGDEDFASLSKDMCEKYSKLFACPEMFFRDGNEIKAVKIDVQEKTQRSKHR